MKREEKIWGSVSHVFNSPHAATSILTVEAGFRCSCHYHEERANQFCVLSGKLVVEDWEDRRFHSSKLYLLEPGNIYNVPSTFWHRFRVLESGFVVEVYWPDRGGVCRADDIIRDDMGGPDDLVALKRRLKELGLL